MFSMPPAITHSASPRRTSRAAEAIASAPDPQTRLTVMAGTDSGRPPLSVACRAGFMPAPAWITLPNTTDETFSGARPLRRTVSPMTSAPRSGAAMAFRLPPNLPMAVRTG